MAIIFNVYCISKLCLNNRFLWSSGHNVSNWPLKKKNPFLENSCIPHCPICPNLQCLREKKNYILNINYNDGGIISVWNGFYGMDPSHMPKTINRNVPQFDLALYFLARSGPTMPFGCVCKTGKFIGHLNHSFCRKKISTPKFGRKKNEEALKKMLHKWNCIKLKNTNGRQYIVAYYLIWLRGTLSIFHLFD